MRSFFQPTLMAMAITVALQAPALAAPVVSAGTTASSGGVAGDTIPNLSSGYAGSSSSAGSFPNGSNAFAFANQSGAYAVSSNAQGRSDASAQAQLRYTVTNTTSVAQTVSMSFHIYGGSINTFLNNAAVLTTGEFLRSLYSASISVNGTSLFASSATLERTDAGISLVKAGQQLNDFGDDASDGVYSWGSGDYALDLGILDAGASLEVLAEVSNASFANVGTYNFSSGGSGGYDAYGNPLQTDTGYGGDGYGGLTCQNSEACGPGLSEDFVKGGSGSFYGDPIDFNLTGADSNGRGLDSASFTLRDANQVPEPGSIALAGLALGAAALARRPRKRR